MEHECIEISQVLAISPNKAYTRPSKNVKTHMVGQRYYYMIRNIIVDIITESMAGVTGLDDRAFVTVCFPCIVINDLIEA